MSLNSVLQLSGRRCAYMASVPKKAGGSWLSYHFRRTPILPLVRFLQFFDTETTMSSRGGSRAAGSDGRDYQHRERVADHYVISATNKWRLKCVLYLHFSMLIMMLLRLSTSLFVGVGVRPPRFLQRMQFPRPQVWEYYWLLSVLPAVVGFLAMRRSKPIMIQQYFLGTLIFGVLPALYGIWDLFDDMVLYWRTKEATVEFCGFPMVVLWNMFLAVVLQVHGFGLNFAWSLWTAWTTRGGKKMQ